MLKEAELHEIPHTTTILDFLSQGEFTVLSANHTLNPKTRQDDVMLHLERVIEIGGERMIKDLDIFESDFFGAEEYFMIHWQQKGCMECPDGSNIDPVKLTHNVRAIEKQIVQPHHQV